MQVIRNATVSAAPPNRWKSFYFNVQNFRDLTTTKDHFVAAPKFLCNGHEWALAVYPGGKDGAPEGYVSIYLIHFSEGSLTLSTLSSI